jgi:hypothetical protein
MSVSEVLFIAERLDGGGVRRVGQRLFRPASGWEIEQGPYS